MKMPRDASGSVVVLTSVAWLLGLCLRYWDYNYQECMGWAGESMRTGRYIVSYQQRRG